MYPIVVSGLGRAAHHCTLVGERDSRIVARTHAHAE
jgi:hypothetical protein